MDIAVDLSNKNKTKKHRERIELIEAINKDPENASVWNNVLNHVQLHNKKPSEAPGRDRLFRRAQSLIPETCNSEEYLSIWLNYIHEQNSTGTAVSHQLFSQHNKTVIRR
jgi:hypothetical protein